MIKLECLPTLKLQIEFSEKTTIWEEVMWVLLVLTSNAGSNRIR